MLLPRLLLTNLGRRKVPCSKGMHQQPDPSRPSHNSTFRIRTARLPLFYSSETAIMRLALMLVLAIPAFSIPLQTVCTIPQYDTIRAHTKYRKEKQESLSTWSIPTLTAGIASRSSAIRVKPFRLNEPLEDCWENGLTDPPYSQSPDCRWLEDALEWMKDERFFTHGGLCWRCETI